MNESIDKYLKKRAVKGPWKIYNTLPPKKYDIVICIPCYRENDFIFETLESLNNQNYKNLSQVLVVVVVNNSDIDDLKVIEDNQITFSKLISNNYNYDLGVVDAYSDKLSLRKNEAGVGMARRIGMDLSIKFLRPSSVMCLLDADTIVSEEYIESILSDYNYKQWNSCTVSFSHRLNIPETKAHIIEYEKLLKETSHHMMLSGSPYFPVPLGPTIICTVESYVAVGGMNKKKASEDFYFLQELIKYGNTALISKELVYPSSRISIRAYLGTGVRMRNCISGDLDIDSLYYSSNSYSVLKKWISLGSKSYQLSFSDLSKSIDLIHPKLKEFLYEFDIDSVWDSLHEAPTKDHFTQQFHRWFDAFKTRKLLKYFT